MIFYGAKIGLSIKYIKNAIKIREFRHPYSRVVSKSISNYTIFFRVVHVKLNFSIRLFENIKKKKTIPILCDSRLSSYRFRMFFFFFLLIRKGFSLLVTNFICRERDSFSVRASGENPSPTKLRYII